MARVGINYYMGFYDDLQMLLIKNGFSIDEKPTGVRKKLGDSTDTLVDKTHFLPAGTSLNTRVRVVLRGYREVPACLCGNPVKWQRQKNDFARYCSVDCAFSAVDSRAKAAASLRNKSAQERDASRRRSVETSIKKHGSAEAAKAARNETMRSNNLSKYGVEHTFQCDDVKSKIKNVFDQRYGGHPLRDAEVQKRQQQTNQDRYGVSCTLNLPIARENLAETFSEKKDEIVHRARATRQDRYGGHHLTNPSIKKKQEQTNLLRYGVASPAQRHLDQESIECFHSDTDFSDLFRSGGVGALMELGYSKDRTITRAYKLGLITPQTTSGEGELGDFLTSLGVSWERTKSLISPYEIDVFIPEHNLAIEYCGVYWHSERFKERDYHARKRKMCSEIGVRLLTIYESEWLYRNHQVKGVLRSILGLNSVVYARKLNSTELSRDVAARFMEKHHVQGASPMFSRAYGLGTPDSLKAVMTFSKQGDGKWELSRFCSDDNVAGGASKLLTYFQRNNDWTSIVSFADLRWSEGALYHRLGFSLDASLKPDYGYVIRDRVEHKFKHRKKFYRDKYDVGSMTEREIMQQEGLYRIYDCGKLRYQLVAR